MTQYSSHLHLVKYGSERLGRLRIWFVLCCHGSFSLRYRHSPSILGCASLVPTMVVYQAVYNINKSLHCMAPCKNRQKKVAPRATGTVVYLPHIVIPVPHGAWLVLCSRPPSKEHKQYILPVVKKKYPGQTS